MFEAPVKINTSFISERINKIRFVSENNLEEPSSFISGSTDRNNIKLWTLKQNEFTDEKEFIPKCCSKLELGGDVTGMEFLDFNNLAVCNSHGEVCIVWINRDMEKNNLKENSRFSKLHNFKGGNVAPCTGLSVYEENIACSGENGSLVVISGNSEKVTYKNETADSIAITAIQFVSYKELIIGNRFGMMKSYDLRSSENSPSTTFMISSKDDKKINSVTCITYHPTQKHIILAGSEEGSITVWDLRQPSFPASYLCAHDKAITEIAFHRTQPTKLFTSSEGGELWKWQQNQNILPQEFETKNQIEMLNPWLNGERAKNKIAISNVLDGVSKSINSFDCSNQSRIVCAAQNEAIYVIDNIF